MKCCWTSFLSGLTFAGGLALSGMTLPSKVTAFLDVGGDWDPALAWVMGAALVVLFFAGRRLPVRPRFSASFATLPEDRIDAKLILGATIFGVGWGLSGICPGPALVSLGAGSTAAWVFGPAMLVGMAAEGALSRWLARPTEPAASRISGEGVVGGGPQ